MRPLRTPEEEARLDARILSAWDAGELGYWQIASEFRIDPRRAKAVIAEAFASGKTQRDPNPPKSKRYMRRLKREGARHRRGVA